MQVTLRLDYPCTIPDDGIGVEMDYTIDTFECYSWDFDASGRFIVFERVDSNHPSRGVEIFKAINTDYVIQMDIIYEQDAKVPSVVTTN